MSRPIMIHGFTLIEILISLFILSIIGAVITTGFNMVVKTQTQVTRKYQALSEMQLTLAIMERDFQQIIDRPIRDENGQIKPAFQMSENGIEFTRAGYINPFSMNKRSTLQRVAYQWENSQLIRYTWPSLDRDPETLPDRQIMLKQVKNFSLQLIPTPKPITASSPASVSRSSGSATDKGISIEMELKDLGYVKRVIAIPTNTFEIAYAA